MSNKMVQLSSLFKRMEAVGLAVVPEYLNGNGIISIHNESDLNNRPTLISLDDLKTVKVVTEYHTYDYDKTIDDRRNAIKTARDIFDFLNDLKIGNHDKVSPNVKTLRIPNVALYYCNNSKNNRVLVTSTRRYNWTEFFNCFDNILLEHSRELDYFTSVIATDHANGGDVLRWNKEVIVPKQWWGH